jgi:hypothetical protein
MVNVLNKFRFWTESIFLFFISIINTSLEILFS